jgi:hypothetical protein
MSVTTAPAHAVAHPRPESPTSAASVREAALVVGVRVLLWVGVQLLVAGLVLALRLPGSGQPLNAAAGWWMVYGSMVDLGTLAVILWLIRREAVSYRSLLGPSAAAWQVALGAVAVLAASTPAIFFSAELTAVMYGEATPPMLAIVDVSPLAAAFSVVVVPLLAELAEPVAYLGVVLPRLERALGRSWVAAGIVVAVWAGEHAFYSTLVTDGGIDLAFAAYRVVSVLPFLAVWTALYYAFDRRLLPVMAARWIFNGGTALAVATGLV